MSYKRFIEQTLGVVLFSALIFVVVIKFLEIFSPIPFKEPKVPFQEYKTDRMKKELSPTSISKVFNEIETMGSRSVGQEGHKLLSQFIKDSYIDSGLEVLSQEIDVMHSVTERNSLLIEDKRIKVYPFLPNVVQPSVTPEEGIRGNLFLVDQKSISEATHFNDKIAIVDLKSIPPKSLALTASRYANLGFSALVLTHSKGIEAVDWKKLDKLSMDIPSNFVRVFAHPEILQYNGRVVTLKVSSRWKTMTAFNHIGVLRASSKNSEAVVIPITYDGFSLLPDINYCSFTALQVAIQQQLLKGFLDQRKTLKRDIIFVANGAQFMGAISSGELLAAIGSHGKGDLRYKELKEEDTQNQLVLEKVERLLNLFESLEFAVERESTSYTLLSLENEDRSFLQKQFSMTLKDCLFEVKEKLLQNKIKLNKEGGNSLDSKAYRDFRVQKKLYDKLNTASSLPLLSYLKKPLVQIEMRTELFQRLKMLEDYHKKRKKRLAEDLKINRTFSLYKNIVIVNPMIQPSGVQEPNEVFTFSCGKFIDHGDQAKQFQTIFDHSIQDLEYSDSVSLKWGGKWHSSLVDDATKGLSLQAQQWSFLSYPAMSIVSMGTDYENVDIPTVLPYVKWLNSIEKTLQILGKSLLSLGYGNGVFASTRQESPRSSEGSVLIKGIGNSVVPNYPMADVIVFGKSVEDDPLQERGWYKRPIIKTNPYGFYKLRQGSALLSNSYRYFTVTPEAVHFGKDGIIDYFKDEGADSQRVYSSIRENYSKNKPIHLILYRGAPVALYDMVNPQTLSPYSGADFIECRSMTQFPSFNKYNGKDGIIEFIPPSESFYILLKSGTKGNKLVQEVTSFLLNTPTGFKGKPDREIDSPGYLAAETPVILNVNSEVARSMLYLNSKRIKVQEPYGMVDPMTIKFHNKSLTYQKNSENQSFSFLNKKQQSTQSVTYSSLNHPIIKESISDAVWGVLWYMGILVPFVFFFEKLVFGFSDIRKALTVHTIVFLVTFFFLRCFHPAFEMIRSSVMILLGFIIILISGGITIILSGKFKENLEALQKNKGQIKGANVNKMGVLITALMLGLNNMHRRKLRTGLTCATITLLTFVMICFTSIQTNIVNRKDVIGKSKYQGLLIQENNFSPIEDSVLSAVTEKFGEKYQISPRQSFLGIKSKRTHSLSNPSIELLSRENKQVEAVQVESAILCTANDPLALEIPLLPGSQWFKSRHEYKDHQAQPIIISDFSAKKLNLIKADGSIKKGALVTINGTQCALEGVFKSSALDKLRDIDGTSILPFDANLLVNPKTTDEVRILAKRNSSRILAKNIIIGHYQNFSPAISAGASKVFPTTTSITIDMGNASYRVARDSIESYLEQSGKEAYFALGNLAYIGKISRNTSLTGLLDMLIPFILAGLTVLNTMNGSVYERKDEIFVYNAVGIAPKYIFFMFMSEAMVYAIVGTMMGYILSQGTGSLLTWLDLTGGMNMNFTSLTTVYASWAIAAAVLLSTWFPARSAMKIAEPSEESGWKLPKAVSNTISFDLPFTFSHLERIAILSFFQNYLENHGEGSSGPFFAGLPELGISKNTNSDDNDTYIPELKCHIWLKPFDLGVSQEMLIELPMDLETKEYISRIHLTLSSGSVDAWQRLNPAFIAKLRRHFLHWRAVSDELKEEYFASSKILMDKSLALEKNDV